MSKQYTSTISIKCWKEHRCVFCDSVYAYDFERTVSETSYTEEGAKGHAQRAAMAALENEVDSAAPPFQDQS